MKIVRLDNYSDGQQDPAIKDYYIGPSFRGKMPGPEKLDVFRSILRDTEASDVFEWWLSLVKDGYPPKKSALSMRSMARFARNLGLVISTRNGRAQFRLAGSNIEELFGQSLKGVDVNVANPFSMGLCKMAWRTQIKERRVRYYTRDLRHLNREYRNISILELPIADDNNERYRFVLSHMIAQPLQA